MRKLLFFLLLLCLGASAQVRTYSDNASGTFVFGLDSYFYGSAGALEFSVNGVPVRASVEEGNVSINGASLSSGSGDTVIGIHDFTGDRSPELMVARRGSQDLSAQIYRLEQGSWKLVGQMESQGGREIRVFRQVVSIRAGSELKSWTWHGGKFDYKSNLP